MMTSNNPARRPVSNGDVELARLREQVTHATLDGHHRVPAEDLAHVVAKTDRLARGHGLIADALRAYVAKYPLAKQALSDALERHDVAIEGVTYRADYVEEN